MPKAREIAGIVNASRQRASDIRFAYIDPDYDSGDALVVFADDAAGVGYDLRRAVNEGLLRGPFKRLSSYTPAAGQFVRLRRKPTRDIGSTFTIEGAEV